MNHTGLSQAGQEEFVMAVLESKMKGTFLEIGSEHPIYGNNSFYLERYLGWNGVMIEYDKKWKPFYDKWRTSRYLIKDASQVDYEPICECIADEDGVIDYLQLDIEVSNGSTIKTLERLDDEVFDKYRFRVITFEHDLYTGWCGEDTRRRSREIFNRRGYIRVFGDVKHNLSAQWCVAFEDWYVHPDLVDMEYINRIKRDGSLNHDEILEILNQE